MPAFGQKGNVWIAFLQARGAVSRSFDRCCAARKSRDPAELLAGAPDQLAEFRAAWVALPSYLLLFSLANICR